jgi:hypothetical protein
MKSHGHGRGEISHRCRGHAMGARPRTSAATTRGSSRSAGARGGSPHRPQRDRPPRSFCLPPGTRAAHARLFGSARSAAPAPGPSRSVPWRAAVLVLPGRPRVPEIYGARYGLARGVGCHGAPLLATSFGFIDDPPHGTLQVSSRWGIIESLSTVRILQSPSSRPKLRALRYETMPVSTH